MITVSTKGRARKEAPVTGVPTLETLKRAFILAEFWRLAAMALPLVTLAGCSVAQAEEHTHRWAKSEEFSNECCARWDLEVGTDDDGNKAFIRRCGKKGVRVTLWYECECGGKKTWSSGCAAVD